MQDFKNIISSLIETVDEKAERLQNEKKFAEAQMLIAEAQMLQFQKLQRVLEIIPPAPPSIFSEGIAAKMVHLLTQITSRLEALEKK